jgi:MFS family permease
VALSTGTAAPQDVLPARNAVLASFFLNGFALATWASRIPALRRALDLSPGQLGVLLLAVSIGSVVALPTSGAMVQRFGAPRVVTAASASNAAGLLLLALGAGVLGLVPVTAVGMFLMGLGIGNWDVAMNLEGAEVERLLGRSVMPRFHASFSLGTVAGAGIGSLVILLGFGIFWHVALFAVLTATLAYLTARRFLPVAAAGHAQPRGASLRAWAEPRVIVIGVMVLAMALTEGVANDWLGVAVVDGYGAAPWLGAAAYALFVTSMTVGRVSGTVLLDSFGRRRVLWATMALAAGGVLLTVLGELPVLVGLGIVLWGLGASLGFPVGMSAAADDPVRAPARISVVSTIGYVAFLAGPPLVGFLGGQFGVLRALLVISVILVPSALAVPAARERQRAPA